MLEKLDKEADKRMERREERRLKLEAEMEIKRREERQMQIQMQQMWTNLFQSIFSNSNVNPRTLYTPPTFSSYPHSNYDLTSPFCPLTSSPSSYQAPTSSD